MKKITLSIVLLLSSITFAQIPSGYYSTATGTGFALKTQLHNIIKDHIDNTYGGLYTTYQTSDIKPNGSVWDMYTNCDFIFGTVANGGQQDNGTNVTAECQLFNREHTVPQSYFGSGAVPMYSDAHFVLPADKKVNATRDDFPYGVVVNATYTSNNGSKLGNNLNSGYSAGYTGTVFEPADQYKGDIARLMFYFATRYEDLLTSFYSSSSTAKVMFDGTSNHSFSTTFLKIFITWHNNDPVSAKEVARNNAIYARQNNRNPFIDHPEYVCQIWSVECTALSSASFLADDAVNIYPNPTNLNQVCIQTNETITKLVLININGQIIKEINNPTFVNQVYELTNLPQGFFLLQLSGDKGNVTKKIIVN